MRGFDSGFFTLQPTTKPVIRIGSKPSGLGASAGLVNIGGGATLDLRTNGGDTAYSFNEGTNTTGFTLVSNLATPGTGINHTLGNLSIGNGNTINIVQGSNVTSGTASITSGAVSFTSGFGAGTITFNPTTANLILASASSTTAGAKTLVLDGTSAGNQITGVVANGTNGSVLLTRAIPALGRCRARIPTVAAPRSAQAPCKSTMPPVPEPSP